MYIMIRMILFSIIGVLTVILFSRKRPQYKKKIILYVCIAWMVASTVSYWMPVENIFIRFDTPEDVFRYTTIGTIVDVEKGENSAMIVYVTKDGEYSSAFSKKDGDKWKIVTSLGLCYVKSDNGFFIFKVMKTDDCYLSGVVHGTGVFIEDSEGSDFKVIGKGFAYAFIGDIGDDYSFSYGSETLNYSDFK